MFVDLTAEPARVQDVDVFTELWVKADSGMTESEVRSALDGWGRVEGEHVWLTIAVLLREGRQDDAAWREGFDKMIDYARTAGWISSETDAVRAHIARQTDH